MTSLLDSVRIMFSPSEAKALFTKNMSNQEKLKIGSAIQAIDHPKRRNVCDITWSIVNPRHCSGGIEMIVSAVAAKNLPTDEWKTIVTQTNCAQIGVSKGEDLAKILLAVAALPPEKRGYLRMASALFKSSEPVENRVLIINAFASIQSSEELEKAKDLLSELNTGSEIALVLNAVGEAKDKDDQFYNRAKNKIRPQMKGEERVKALEEVELDGYNSSLDSPIMANKERIQLKRAIEALPPKKRQIITSCADKLINHNFLNADEKIVILKALTALSAKDLEKDLEAISDSARRLIQYSMSADDRVKILNAVAALSAQGLEAISDSARRLIQYSMNSDDIVRILNAVAALPAQDLEAIFNSADHLIEYSMSADDIVRILNAIAALPAQGLAAISDSAKMLCTYMMGAADKIMILNAIAVIPPNELQDFTHIVKGWITSAMNAKDRTGIVNAVAAIPPQKRLTISDRANLLAYNMSADDKVSILNAIAALPAQGWEAISNRAVHLIRHDMNADDIVRILNAVAALPAQDLEAIFNSADHLIEYSMSAADKIKILDAIAAIPPRERLAISDRAGNLINHNMDADDRVMILNAIAALTPEDRIGIVIQNSVALNAAALVALINDSATRNTHNSEPEGREALPAHGGRRGEGGMTEDTFQRIIGEFTGNAVENAVAVIYNINELSGDIPRFCVDPSKLSQRPVEVLSKLSKYVETHGVFPSLRFWSDTKGISRGIDSGGLTRDFITQLFQALSRKTDDERTLLPMKEQDPLFLPLVDARSTISVENQVKHYQLIGYLYAHALKSTDANKIKTGPLFHPAVFEMIHALSEADINQIPSNLSNLVDVPLEIYKKQLKVYLKSLYPKLFPPTPLEADAAIEAFVTDGKVTEQMIATWPKDGNDPDAVDVTKAEVMLAVGFDKAVLPALIIGRSMQENGANWGAIQSPADLEAGIQGGVTKEIAVAAINADMEGLTETKIQKKEFLIKYIEKSTQEELEKLCYAACGSRVLPPLKISSSTQELGFHTCFRSIDLPVCETFDEFCPLLSAAVELAQGGDYTHN